MLAHQAAERGDGPKAARLLLRHDRRRRSTFLVVKAFEWTDRDHATASRSPRAPSGRSTTRRPACTRSHVIAGAIIMLFVAQDAAKNQELHRVELIGIYWHFVDIVWIFLFPLLYIAK